MTLRSDLKTLRRYVPSVNGPCPGIGQAIHLVEDGGPLPDPPLCPLCGEQHWPHPSVQRICVVEIRKSYSPPTERSA
jgi:hypothetical protein